ncbi:hypothetical protein RvY_07668, partial [Ramazzottius varieornatus]
LWDARIMHKKPLLRCGVFGYIVATRKLDYIPVSSRILTVGRSTHPDRNSKIQISGSRKVLITPY